MLYFDHRWDGAHGIGRFARELGARLPHMVLPLAGRPMAPADPFRLALALRHLGREGVFFSPGYNAPLAAPMPFVFTLHDLNHIERPENSSLAKRLYYATVLRSNARRAARVFTVSEYSRERIVKWAGISAASVVNVGNGVGTEFSAHGPMDAGRPPYFLCVSNRRLHKNERRVVSAFAAAQLPRDTELVMTGSSSDDLQAHIAKCGVNDRVRFSGTLSDAALARLYRGSIALVFPSLYEGFGLPVVEAMACGAPVVTSTTTALPEIAGDAAILVDPLSVEQIAAALTRLHDDANQRARLREAGLRRAAQFSWAAVAQRAASAIAGLGAHGA